MRQGLDGLGVVNVGADPDGRTGRVGPAVRPPALPPLEPVAMPSDLPGQLLPQPGGGPPGQQHRGDVGEGLPVGLGQGRTRTPPGTTRRPKDAMSRCRP